MSAAPRPNVVLILCDDLGWGDLACYGSKKNDTPRIDEMARQGLRLTDYYAPAPLCTPSRAALMTGRYAFRSHLETGPRYPVLLPKDDAGLREGEFTLAAMLRNQGYATGCFGKWHLGDQAPFLPTDHGFDQFFGLPYSHDMRPSHPDQARFNFPPLPVMADTQVIETEPDPQTLDQRFVDAALNFMQQQAQPWFVYLALTAPHVPLHPTDAMRQHSRNGDYGAVIATIDHCVGQMLDGIEQLSGADNTLVIFTSDHGAKPAHGGDNGPWRGEKNTTLEGGMRVPCLMRWQGAIPAGVANDQLASHLDLLPTLGALVGATLPPDHLLDGEDMTELLQHPDRPTVPRCFLYYNDRGLQAVRYGAWKLHLQGEQLHHLADDPTEEHDVSASHPDIKQLLTRFIEEAHCS